MVTVHEPYQLLPPLTQHELEALKADITEHGVLVPIIIDENGDIIDGHNRHRIATELGLECPHIVRHFTNERDKRSLARSVNMQRRHLNTKQKRQIIADELQDNPQASNNSIAQHLGVSDMTVDSVRRQLGLHTTKRIGADGKTYQHTTAQTSTPQQLDQQPPFPWYGGKRRVANQIWKALGTPNLYIEPFAGSLATLLHKPYTPNRLEIVNDKDAYITNYWRATKQNPHQTAQWANYPVTETDLQARQEWLIKSKNSLRQALRDDPEYYDAKIAGWWVWGLASWIKGWPDLNTQTRPFLGNQGINRKGVDIEEWFTVLSERLRHVKVCCGDWERVVTDGVLSKGSLRGVFLDPPYDLDVRTKDLYGTDEEAVAVGVRNWALEHGDDPYTRIVLAGHVQEHDEHMPSSWRRVFWAGNLGKNREKECLWLSPSCVGDFDEQTGSV